MAELASYPLLSTLLALPLLGGLLTALLAARAMGTVDRPGQRRAHCPLLAADRCCL
jgi:hypothetical protein